MTRREVDLADPAGLVECLDQLTPAVILNAAAYTQVEQAEREEDVAYRVNAVLPGILAQWCARRNVPLVHFSTDYVFNGAGELPWTEDDLPAPLNAYGRTKWEGERQVAAAGGKWLILRTSWVYDVSGKNFFTTMLRLGAEQECVSVVSDQYGAPTFARQLAEASLAAWRHAERKPEFPSGIYHLCHAGDTSWFGFAKAIFSAARRHGLSLKVRAVEPISTSAYAAKVRRPANCRLNTAKAGRVLGVSLPDWRAGLRTCIETLP